ncbi:MAG TPA: SDR family NAD(P)-dependent oxidoreductase [Spongiibacteraceae bacterium]|nr:SDR family NAD(P)-dependent oxidoreductase [Spongiibacteraceae bacterium]
MQDFNNKVAVITGGASGVGKAIGERLGRAGAKIVIADIEQSALDKVVAEFSGKGIEAIGHRTDVTKLESVEALAEKSFAHFGAVHLLFNNAGVGAGEAMTMWETGMNEWAWAIGVNVMGVVHGIKAFMPRLQQQNLEAHIVNTTSSNGGLIVLPNTPAYAATKAAVTAMTEALYFQLTSMNSPIKVSLLFPGPHIVRTGLFDSGRNRPADLPRDANALDMGIRTADDLQKLMENFGQKIEITTPEEVADQVFEDLQKDLFYILRNTEKTEAAVRARTEWVLARENPSAPDVL